MKKFLIAVVVLALSIPAVTFALPSSVDRIINRIEPLIKSDYIRAAFFIASSTATSTLPVLDVTTLFRFGGIVGTVWSDFCTAITGGAGLCDGTDATGGGGTGSNFTVVPGGLRTSTTTDFVQAANFIATSTTGTSTFAGNAFFAKNIGVGTPNPSAPLTLATTSSDLDMIRVLRNGAQTFSIDSDGALDTNGGIITLSNIRASAYIQSSSDIYTDGVGDDLWLGIGDQTIALFSAGANGVTRMGTTNASGTAMLTVNGDVVMANLMATGTATTTNQHVSGMFRGAGLTDCDTAATSKLLWDTTLGVFSCGSDQSGGGSGGLSTTTVWTIGNLARVASNGSVDSVATSSLGLAPIASPTFTGTVTLPAGQVVNGVTLSTTAGNPNYLRGDGLYMNLENAVRIAFSNTATGLTYTNATGVTSLTAGFNIPLTASTTDWATFRDTPSTRITAGTNLSWSGNTLNATGGGSSAPSTTTADYVVYTNGSVVFGLDGNTLSLIASSTDIGAVLESIMTYATATKGIPGGKIAIKAGEYTSNGTTTVYGENNNNNSTWIFEGSGSDSTNITQIDGSFLHFTNRAQVVVKDLSINVSGTENGFTASGLTSSVRSVWSSNFSNLKIYSSTNNHTGHAFNFGNDFRNHYENIELFGVGNGFRTYTQGAAFNNGDSTFVRWFCEIYNTTAGICFDIDATAGGKVNQSTFIDVNGISDVVGSSTFIKMRGANWNTFIGLNAEQFATTTEIISGNGNNFQFEYVTPSPTGNYFFMGATAYNNSIACRYMDNPTGAHVLLTDLNTLRGQHNTLQGIDDTNCVMQGVGTYSVATTSATVIKDFNDNITGVGVLANYGEIKSVGEALVFNFRSAADSFVKYTSAGLRFFTSNAERLTILSNGNIGIGTTTPATALHVVGTTTLATTTITSLTATLLNGLAPASYLARVNHTGTQLAATISDFVANVRTSISETITGLDYNNTTGVLSTTAGFEIPLTASTTNWNSFYDTPSTRITAGTNLSWAGNTLNATGGGTNFWTDFATYLSPATTTRGLIINASSTIGNGTNIGGLTVFGRATTSLGFSSGAGGFTISDTGTITRIGNGAVSISSTALQLANGGGNVLLQNNAGGVANSGIELRTGSAGGPIIFSTSGTETARFDRFGNLGLGTTSTSSQLMVATTTSTGGLVIRNLVSQSCLGTDATGAVITGTCAGGTGLATTSVWTVGNLARVASSGAVDSVALGGGLGLTGATINAQHVTNAQVGITYTYVAGDTGKYVTHSNAAAIAGTLPQAGASFPDGWTTYVHNIGAGALTITPTISTINGALTLVLNNGQSAMIVSNGTNYQAFLGASSGGGAGDMVLANAQTNSGLKTFLTGTFGLRNVANTFTALFSNANTAARTYTLQDRDGTLADNTDLALKANLASPTFTGTVTLPASQVVNGVTLSTGAGTANFLRGDGTYQAAGGTVLTGTTGQMPYYAANGTTLTATSTIAVNTNSTVSINGATTNAALNIKTFLPNGQAMQAQTNTIGDIAFSTYNTGDSFTRFSFLGDGSLNWGAGAFLRDVTMSRTASGTLNVANAGSATSVFFGIGSTTPAGTLGVTGTGYFSSDVTIRGVIKVVGAFFDSLFSAGTSGQILSSTVTGTKWKNTTQYNTSVTSQTGFAADTYLVGSSIAIPAGSLQAKTSYACRFNVVKTAAGTATPIINVRIGTAGSTADASRGALTFSAQTGVVDEGTFTLNIIFRTVGAGTSAVVQSLAKLDHRLSITGLGVGVSEAEIATSAGFDSTVANSIIGLSVNGGASAAWTINVVSCELQNLN